MEITFRDSSIFRSSIEALKELLPQAQLRIEADGIRIHGMDVSHVGFVDTFLAATDCTVYRIGAPLMIGIHTVNLARTLSAVGSGDTLTLGLSKSKDKLVVSYVNEKISKKAVYEVPTIDIQEDALDIPEISYSASVSAKTADVYTAMKETAFFGDSIGIRLDEDGFHMTASGDMGSTRQTLENTEDREMTLQEDFVEATFGSKYMLTILKGGSPLASNLTLEFDKDQPLRATFRYGAGSHFIAYLAPKIADA